MQSRDPLQSRDKVLNVEIKPVFAMASFMTSSVMTSVMAAQMKLSR